MSSDLEKWIDVANRFLKYYPFRTFINIINSRTFARIVGKGFSTTNEMCNQISPFVKVNRLEGYDSILVLSADTNENLQIMLNIIQYRINMIESQRDDLKISDFKTVDFNINDWKSPTDKVPQILSSESKKRHILIDNSNIFFSARTSLRKPSYHNDYTMRISIKELTSLLELGTQEIGYRFVAGSKIKKGNSIWNEYESIGYTCKAIPTGDDKREKFVDTVLHSAGLQIAAESQYLVPGSTTLVIATGDGNDNDSLTSFPKTVFAAVQAGMRVEIWSWASSRSKNYKKIVDHFTDGRVTLHDLDPYFSKIVYYVKNYRTSPDITRESIISSGTGYREREYVRERVIEREHVLDRDRSRSRDRDRSRDRGHRHRSTRGHSPGREPSPDREHYCRRERERVNNPELELFNIYYENYHR